MTEENNANKKIYYSVGGGLLGFFLFFYLLSVYWSFEPDQFEVEREVAVIEADSGSERINGYVTVSAIIQVAETLLDKSGGYISNDVMPPGLFMDNMPAWEFGVLVQVRDLTRVLRNDLSRSQSQSVEQEDLVKAQPAFSIDNTSWAFPSAEGEYRKGIKYLSAYREKLASRADQDSQFYARADNLAAWLREVEKSLGSLSQRLSASVGQDRVNIDLSGEQGAKQSTRTGDQVRVKTSWFQIDDVFYEARGACWALIHFLRAVDLDFASVLDKKNAVASLRQIIRELEATQQTIWSPMILNGSGFGAMANHSLVMASYISRANAAIIDLRDLLNKG